MGRTVRELQASIGADELHEWMAYSELEPFGAVAADFRNATAIAQHAALATGKQQQVSTWLLGDYRARSPGQSPAQMLAVLTTAAAVLKGAGYDQRR